MTAAMMLRWPHTHTHTHTGRKKEREGGRKQHTHVSLDLAYTICVFVGVDRTFSGGGGLTVAGGWVFGICCHTHTNTHIYTHIIPTYVGVCG